MFIEDENWNDEPGAKAPSTGNAFKSVQKANSFVKPKGVGRKSLLRTLKTLGSLPDMKGDALQEDSDCEKETVPTPHTKRKKKRSKRQKQAGASENEAENGDSSLADTVEKNPPENLKKKKELKYVKKDFDNGENTQTSSELNEQKGENTHTVNRKQWRNKMKNKKKCKNKFRQNKLQQHLNKAGTPEQHMTEETKPTGLHCNNYTNAVPQAAALKHKPKKRKRAEEEDEHPSLTPVMQTIIEDEQLTKKEMKNKTSNKVEKGLMASKQATGKKASDSQEPPKPMKKLKLEMSKEEKQKRDKLRKVLNRQEPTKQENLSAHGNEDDAPHLQQDVKESLPDRSAALRSRMMQRLESARFRYINEVLYTTSSEEAKRLFKQDPEAFEIYHKGFTAQVQKWPSNPVDAIVSYIRRKPSSLVVADFGCGDCKIARCVKNKVHSFDLAPVCHLVTVCDMANVPLDDGTVDIAVFCLSLMGTNLADFLAEANRVLVMGGVLKIAEVASRFENLRSFLTALASLGFKLSSKDTENSHFFSFEFMKTGDASGNVKKLGLQLNPCLYKKR